MKGVILICLLSLSGCFSAPNQEAASTTKLTTLATATPDTSSTHPTKEADSKSPAVVPQPTPVTPEKDPAKTSTETVAPPNAKNETAKDNKTAKDDPNHKEATTVDPKSKTEANPTPAPVTTPAPTTPTTTPAAAPKKNETKPGEKEKEATTEKIEASTTAPKIVQASRSFDGASFIGGIILTLGLLAIGFMGFKYYKNQTERNYHTL